METKDVLYAAVGAPVVAARKVGDKVTGWRERMGEETGSYSRAAEKAIEGWAVEGKKVIDQIGSGNVVEEISSKVDLDQAKHQVGKLRDQLEDMLDTWRASFRPEKVGTSPAKQPAAPASEPAAEKPAAKATTTEKPVAKATTTEKPVAKTTTSKKPAAKTTTSKKPAAEKPAAKKPTTKPASTEKPASKSA